jgi:hypothetical protein
VCAYPKFDTELSICKAKSKHRFHIKEVSYTPYFSLKNNTALDDIFVHIALHYLIVFSNRAIQHCQHIFMLQIALLRSLYIYLH